MKPKVQSNFDKSTRQFQYECTSCGGLEVILLQQNGVVDDFDTFNKAALFSHQHLLPTLVLTQGVAKGRGLPRVSHEF